jgi:hypothetical protein
MISIVFESDAASTFDTDIGTICNGQFSTCPKLLETGDIQDVSGPDLLNSLVIDSQGNPNGIQIEIQSNLDVVPEPDSRLLLATGLLGCIACLGVRKSTGDKRQHKLAA